MAAAFSMMAAAAADEDQNGPAREAGSQATGERYAPEGEGLSAVRTAGARTGDGTVDPAAAA